MILANLNKTIHSRITSRTWNTNRKFPWPGSSPTSIFPPEFSLLKGYFREHEMEKLILKHKTKDLVLALTFSRYVVLSKALQFNGPQIPHLQVVVGREIWRRLDAYPTVLSFSSWITDPQLFIRVNVPILRGFIMFSWSQQWQFYFSKPIKGKLVIRMWPMRLKGHQLGAFRKSLPSLIKEKTAQEGGLFGPIHFLFLGLLKCEIVTIGAAATCLGPWEERLQTHWRSSTER